MKPRVDIGSVLERTDLGALLDELAQPASWRTGPGRRWHCPAPDHDDHRASVTMHRDRHGHERWRCWSADHRGDAVDLVMLTTGRDRADAIGWLAARVGVHAEVTLPPVQRRSAAAAALTPSPLVEQYVNACHRVLHGSAGRPIRAWLHQRGFDDDTIAANRLGADPGRALMSRARGLPFGAGPAAVFPVFDPAAAVVYLQARALHPEEVGRKYDNPAASIAPHPRLAFPVAREARAGVLLVCEGLPDALTAAQAGYRSVALLGAQTPDMSVATRIANHADRHDATVVIVTDPDPAGRHATASLAGHLDQLGVTPLVVTPPEGCDLNDWALAVPGWHHDLDRHLDIGLAVDLAIGVDR